MIFYFSGTGNSRWAAETLASRTGDSAHDIISLKKAPDLRQEKQVGLVFPVYAWGPPESMLAFAKTLERTAAFTFGVCTCGEEAGKAMKKLAKAYPLDSCYSLVMPNNYIIGSDVDDEATIRRKLSAARQALDRLSCEILEKQAVYRVEEGSLPALKSSVVNLGFNRFARSTKPFYADDRCNGCGLCAKSCPASTITLVNGKPAWGTRCFQCLRCIHICPQKAIQYGKETEHRGRYLLKNYLDEL